MKTDLHDELMKIAEQVSKEHIEKEDGADCFNLFTFLEDLEDHVLGHLDQLESRFQLDGSEIARYIWFCLALKKGDLPDGNTFQQKPILD